MTLNDSLIRPLLRMATHPVDELNRWQRSGRYVIDLLRHCWRQLMEDRAEEMAAALTYRTIFSLVPLIVLGLVVFRAFIGPGQIQNTIQPAIFDFFGVPKVERGYEPVVVTPKPPEERTPQTGTNQPVADEGGNGGAASAVTTQSTESKDPGDLPSTSQQKQEERQVRASIQKALGNLVQKVSNINFTGIGIVGVIVFIYAAMTLAWAVEWDFDIIFKSPASRPWHLRVPIYWTVITLGMGLLAISLVLSSQFVTWVEGQHIVWGPLLAALSRFFAFVAGWVMLFLLYFLLPNTRVHLKPAVLGSFIAAVLWEVGKIGFQAYTSYALPYSAFYGSLGLIPLFLLWVYISWMIVLFGLELTYALQMMRGRWGVQALAQPPAEEEAMLDPRWLIPMMTVVGQAFEEGRTATLEHMAQRVSLPTRTISNLADQACKAGLILQTANCSDEANPAYTLAMPPERIEMARLLELGRGHGKHAQIVRDAPGRAMLTRLDAAEREAAHGATLATILQDHGTPRDESV